MATKAKSTKDDVPTNAQPETSTGQPLTGYTPVSGSSTTTPTAEATGPYSPMPIATQLGSQQLPKSQHKETIQTGPTNPDLPASAQNAMAVAKLASYFGLKDQPLGITMEQQVIRALALKYNVILGRPGSEDVKTTKAPKSQMTEAQARTGVPQPGTQTQTSTQVSSTPDTAISNKKALAEIATKMGIDDPGDNPLVAIAGVDTSGASGNILTSIVGDTVAQVYANFVTQSFNPKTGALTAKGKTYETALEQAGYLDLNANLGTPTANEIQQGFQAMLNVAVNGQQTGDPNTTVAPGQGIAGALTAGQAIAKATDANAPPSEAYATVQGVASEFGVYLSPQQITDIANRFAGQITAEGSPADVENSIKDLVIQQYNPDNPNDPAGVANTMYNDIQQAALQYQLPIASDPQQISQMVQKGLQTASVAYPASAATDVQNQAIELFQQQASGLYPSLAAQIKAGNTVQSLVAPYYSVAQSVTGVPASTMMADNPGGGTSKWAGFLQGGNDPSIKGGNPSASTSTAGQATGTPQMQTLDQWKQTLMQDPQYGFRTTQGAQDMAEQLSTAILNEFGRATTEGTQNAPLANNYSPNSALAEGNPTTSG